MLENILNIALVIDAIALIILCLLQSGKSDGIVNALSGQSSNLFAQTKERGMELVISRLTMGLAIAFFVIAIMLRMG
ncbi:preprotein translocase subunit SecG [Tannockella kyphosi]|uniref:preprotein translocase subunit SecG n=1 Tax=Tannockella kyphosi TaxID=2899121 RepID=UPI0020122EE9|nr:preprotein translocase subunit SecG [Tannockella kyphosi]